MLPHAHPLIRNESVVQIRMHASLEQCCLLHDVSLWVDRVEVSVNANRCAPRHPSAPLQDSLPTPDEGMLSPAYTIILRTSVFISTNGRIITPSLGSLTETNSAVSLDMSSTLPSIYYHRKRWLASKHTSNSLSVSAPFNCLLDNMIWMPRIQPVRYATLCLNLKGRPNSSQRLHVLG